MKIGSRPVHAARCARRPVAAPSSIWNEKKQARARRRERTRYHPPFLPCSILLGEWACECVLSMHRPPSSFNGKQAFYFCKAKLTPAKSNFGRVFFLLLKARHMTNSAIKATFCIGLRFICFSPRRVKISCGRWVFMLFLCFFWADLKFLCFYLSSIRLMFLCLGLL